MRRLAVFLALVLVVVAAGLFLWSALRAETGAPVGEAAARLCGGLDRRLTGRLRDADLSEVSGAVTSRSSDGALWLHNDSGDAPRLYATAPDGGLLGTYDVTAAEAFDWEDIAAGTSPEGESRLYIGDIGDNKAERTEIAVYSLPEPPSAGAGGATAAARRIRLRYPDGSHDAEVLLADPVTGDLLVVTKDLRGRSGVYRAAAPHGEGLLTMEKIATLDLGAAGMATGGDISPAGDAIVVRSYFSTFVWGRRPGESLAEAFARPPCRGPRLIERQGEALAFTGDGRGFYTVTEGSGAQIDLWR